MVERHLTFHIPQEAEPGTLVRLLEAMNIAQADFDSVASLLDFAQQQGLMPRSEIPIFAGECGLLQRNEVQGIGLSETALAILPLKPEVRADVIHFIIYSGWKAEQPRERTTLWTYRQVIDLLWERPGVNLSKTANILAEEIRNQIQETFDIDPSFSAKSIRGVRKWLEALYPPVIEDDRFAHRFFCPPELALLALGWAGQASGGDIGIDLLLTPERRAAISRLCLLDPSTLDRVLDWTLPLYPAVVRPGTSAGSYGRFVRFLKWPELRDLLH